MKNLNLSIPSGSTVGLVGATGSGKTTLIRLLLRFHDTPTSGKYLLNNKRVSDLDDDSLASIRNKEIGFVFQSFHLLPGLTALENVALPLELQGDREALRLKMFGCQTQSEY